MWRLLAALLLLLAAPFARAEELVPATSEEERAIAAAVVDGLLAVVDRDGDKVLATADAELAQEMAVVRDLALTLPPERLLPPFDGETCAPLWASQRILYLRASYPAGALRAFSAVDLLRFAITDPYGTGTLTFSRTLAQHPELELRAKLLAEPASTLRQMLYLNSYFRAGNRAYAAVQGYAPAIVSVALRQPDGSWQPDYRFWLEFWREMEINLAYAYALDRRDIEPAMLTPEQFLYGLAIFLPRKLRSRATLQALAEPLAGGGSFTCLPPLNTAPLVLCLDGAATCG